MADDKTNPCSRCAERAVDQLKEKERDRLWRDRVDVASGYAAALSGAGAVTMVDEARIPERNIHDVFDGHLGPESNMPALDIKPGEEAVVQVNSFMTTPRAFEEVEIDGGVRQAVMDPDPSMVEQAKRYVFSTESRFDVGFWHRSPLFIEIAMRYYWQPGFNPIGSFAIENIQRELCEAGLIERNTWDSPTYVPVKDALRVYVEALGSVALPVRRWVMP
jgi:hypothetical protein